MLGEGITENGIIASLIILGGETKMKSNINWNNHCMRKFGKSIRKEIEKAGNKMIISTFRAKLIAEKQIVKPGTFVVPDLVGKS